MPGSLFPALEGAPKHLKSRLDAPKIRVCPIVDTGAPDCLLITTPQVPHPWQVPISHRRSAANPFPFTQFRYYLIILLDIEYSHVIIHRELLVPLAKAVRRHATTLFLSPISFPFTLLQMPPLANSFVSHSCKCPGGITPELSTEDQNDPRKR